MSKVFYSILDERTCLEIPFRHFRQICHRAGQLGYTEIQIPRMRPDMARETIVERFKKLTQDPDDFLVFMDVDHAHPVDLIERLVAHNKEVVGALAFRSNPNNPLPCFFIRQPDGSIITPRTYEKGLIRVTIAGTGAMAIKRSVFTKLDEAGYDLGQFKYQYHEDGTSSSEEILFGQMCESLFIETYVDTTLEIPHVVSGHIDELSYQDWLNDHPEKEHQVSVIIPQRGRFEKLELAVNSLISTSPAQCVIVYDEDESEKIFELAKKNSWTHPKVVLLKHTGRAIDKWNYGAKVASGDVLMVAGNDVEFTPGWYESAIKVLESLPDGGMVSVWDGYTDPDYSSPHFLMTREYMDKENGGVLMPPCYEFYYCDVENRQRAKEKGKYAVSMGRVIHRHPLTSEQPIDEIHKLGYLTHQDGDKKLFKERIEKGFPIDW